LQAHREDDHDFGSTEAEPDQVDECDIAARKVRLSDTRLTIRSHTGSPTPGNEAIMSFTKWVMCFALLCIACGEPNPVGEDGDDPGGAPPEGTWSGVWNRYHVAASSDNAMVLSMGGHRATAAGMAMLRQGGNAADAVLAASMAHIVHLAGLAVSFGGVISMVYYDAQTGQAYSMNAGFRVPLAETNPLTIPRSASGRTAMVPGFFAGVQAAHDNYGRLPFAEVFQPAIELAENGFPMPAWMANVVQANWHILSLQPEAVAVFTKPDGTRYQANEQFTQPLLAETLRRVAAEGADYVYRGEWAQKFVSIIQREGGRIQMDDMEGYRANLAPATHTTFNGYDIYSIGLPAPGGVGIVEAFNLIELSDIDTTRHYIHSAEDLLQFIRIVRVGPMYRNFLNTSMVAESFFPGNDFSQTTRLTKAAAQVTWERILSGEWYDLERAVAATGGHSDHTAAELVVDAAGNVAAVVHTINTGAWGNTGIFVDGVSIPDIAGMAQAPMAMEGPGNYHYDDICPSIALRDGSPVLAAGSAGYGLHSVNIQNTYNILAHGFSPSSSMNQPKFLYAWWWGSIPQRILRGSFGEDVLSWIRAQGQPLEIVDDPGQAWAGITIQHQDGGVRLLGATAHGHIDGY
jgi:gamma-glutamyltranspeptidase/glutathione hydrolase